MGKTAYAPSRKYSAPQSAMRAKRGRAKKTIFAAAILVVVIGSSLAFGFQIFTSHYFGLSPQDQITKKYFESGGLNAEVKFDSNSLDGEYKFYYESGALEEEHWFVDGEVHGKSKKYYESGPLLREVTMVRGTLEGPAKTYYETGELWVKSDYLDWKLNGIVNEYADSGELRFRDTYKAGRRTSHEFVGVEKVETGILKLVYKDGILFSEQNYVNGAQHGSSAWHYRNGKVWTEIDFKDGQPDGIKKVYLPSGALHSELEVKEGLAEGAEKIYYQSGKLKSECQCKANKRSGACTSYYESGAPQSKLNYLDGKIEGLVESFYPDGKPSSETEFKNNKPNGFYKVYAEDGTLEIEGMLRDGRADGAYKYRHPGGALWAENYFVRGKKEGTEKRYYPKGNIQSESIYLNGHLNGMAKTYGSGGNLLTEQSYSRGRLSGRARGYTEAGALKYEEFYWNGARLEFPPFSPNETKKTYYSSGALKEEAHYRFWKRHGVTKKYTEKNFVWREETYRSGKLHGIAKSFYDNGKVEAEEYFKNGNKDGVTKEYREDGTLREVSNWEKGLREGPSKQYSKAGKITGELHWKQGLMDGVSKAYSPDGKLLNEIKWSKGKVLGASSAGGGFCPLPLRMKSKMVQAPALRVSSGAGSPAQSLASIFSGYERGFKSDPSWSEEAFFKKFSLAPGDSTTNLNARLEDLEGLVSTQRLRTGTQDIKFSYFETGWPLGVSGSWNPRSFFQPAPLPEMKNLPKFKYPKQGYGVLDLGPRIEGENRFYFALDFDESRWPEAELYVAKNSQGDFSKDTARLKNGGQGTIFASVLILPVAYATPAGIQKHPMVFWAYGGHASQFSMYSICHWRAVIEFPDAGRQITAVLFDDRADGIYSNNGLYLDDNGDGKINNYREEMTEPPLLIGQERRIGNYWVKVLSISEMGDSASVELRELQN